MGRGLLLASGLGFAAMTGIELNPVLAGMARRNMRHWRTTGNQAAPSRILCRDAVETRLPSRRCLALLFNPFGAPVMRRVLRAWAGQLQAEGGELDLLYVNNEQEGDLERAPGFKRVFLGKVARSRTDAIADHRILANQLDGEYAASNFEDCSIWRWQPD